MEIKFVSADTPALDVFLRQVADENTSQLLDQQEQKIIAFNRKTGKAEVTQPNFWSGFLRGLGFGEKPECYLVDVYSGYTVKSNLAFHLFSNQFGPMDLSIVVTSGAYVGRETRLVEELVRRKEPAKAMRDLLQTIIQTSIADIGEGIFEDFAKFQGQLTTSLRTKGEGAGLRWSASARKSGTAVAAEARMTFDANDIQLQPKGYSDFIPISFDAVLTRNAGVSTFTLGGAELKDALRKLLVLWMQEYVRTGINYNTLTGTLHETFREDLIKHWNQQLQAQNKGWKVAELRFLFADILPDSFRFEQLEIQVALKEESIPLTNTITLTLDDAQKFKNSRIENIEIWLKEKLRQTTQSILTGISFAELTARIDEFQNIIKNDLNKEASQIGYKVKYLLTSGPVSRMKHSFNFEFEDIEQDFDTDSNDRVKLNVIVNGRIINYNHENLKRILTPTMDLAEEMKKEAKREVRKFILRCKPEEYYLDFDTIVGPELDTRLRELLYRQFNVAKDVDIVLRWQGSALIERLRRLMYGFKHTDVQYQNGQLQFRIKFNIEGVHKQQWGRFAARGYEDPNQEKEVLAEEIRVAVENTMRQEFDKMVMHDSTQFPDFVKAFAIMAVRQVVENTGLIIHVNHVEQLKNEYFDRLGELKSNHALDRLEAAMDEIKNLDEQIKKFEKSGLLPQRVKELQAKKSELQQQVMGKNFSGNQLRAGSDEDLAAKWLNSGTEPRLDVGQ